MIGSLMRTIGVCFECKNLLAMVEEKVLLMRFNVATEKI
jgi:hypothetical protein